MKIIITIILTFSTITSFCQSINFTRDTTQNLLNTDGGSVAFADIDLDGDNDLVITGKGSSGITSSFYINNGNGNFSVQSQTALVNVLGGSAKFSDIDNDGDMDLLVTGYTSEPRVTANLYLNNGKGFFSIVPGTPFVASKAGDIDFGDIDGDNDEDLIMTGLDSANNAFAKLFINEGGVFKPVNDVSFIAVMSSSAEFIDVDNDNDLDLLLSGVNDSNKPSTSLYENDGIGGFTLVAGIPFENIEAGDISYGDTDNDGDQDILLTGKNDSGQIIANLYINNGASFSLLSNTPFPGVMLHSSSFADFNNNGMLDLLLIGVSSKGGLIAHIYENQGSNEFILADSSLSGSYNGSSAVADVNGDSKLDIVTTGTSFTAPVRGAKIYINNSQTVAVNKLESNGPSLNIFPNPTNGMIRIETSSTSSINLEIYNSSGKLIMKDNYLDSVYTFYLDQPSGLYFLHLTLNGKRYSRKIQVI